MFSFTKSGTCFHFQAVRHIYVSGYPNKYGTSALDLFQFQPLVSDCCKKPILRVLVFMGEMQGMFSSQHTTFVLTSPDLGFFLLPLEVQFNNVT